MGVYTNTGMNSPLTRLRQIDGIVVLNKPEGPSSARCLVPFKRQGQKKIGHGGTLDPMASGVLLVLLGQATKLSSWLLGSGRKIYSGLIRIGAETSTWDGEGEVTSMRPWTGISDSDVAAEIAAWTELKEQDVPAYSAAKHNGQPLYKMARKGHDAPVKVKKAEIFRASLLEIGLPFVRFRVECGSGSYIRSLAHSLGVRLGCGATLIQLTREYSHPFDIAQACDMEAVRSGDWLHEVHALPEALPHWPCIELTQAQAADIRQGRPVACMDASGSSHAFLCHAGAPLAISRREGLLWHIERGLWNT